MALQGGEHGAVLGGGAMGSQRGWELAVGWARWRDMSGECHGVDGTAG